jgi:hypothetical protein
MMTFDPMQQICRNHFSYVAQKPETDHPVRIPVLKGKDAAGCTAAHRVPVASRGIKTRGNMG